MALNQHRPVARKILAGDREGLITLKRMPDYAPVTHKLSVESIVTIEAGLRTAEEEEVHALKAYEAARATRIAAEWEFHNAMLEAKSVVMGQYGVNSEEVQALGLKKKVEYRRPVRRHSDAM